MPIEHILRQRQPISQNSKSLCRPELRCWLRPMLLNKMFYRFCRAKFPDLREISLTRISPFNHKVRLPRILFVNLPCQWCLKTRSVQTSLNTSLVKPSLDILGSVFDPKECRKQAVYCIWPWAKLPSLASVLSNTLGAGPA